MHLPVCSIVPVLRVRRARDIAGMSGTADRSVYRRVRRSLHLWRCVAQDAAATGAQTERVMDDNNMPSSVAPLVAAPTTPLRLVRRSRLPGPGWIWSVGAVVSLVSLVSVLTQMALARGEARQTAAATRAVATAQAAHAPQLFETLATGAMTSAADGWAFGMIGEEVHGPYPQQATPKAGCQLCMLILHYDGHTWSRVSTDPSLDIPVVSVAMLSPSDGWA